MTLSCSICADFFELSDGGIRGTFGICPVSFCAACYTSMVDMVAQGCFRCQDDDTRDEEENRSLCEAH